jgi:aminoglycoside phosphotransferase (APT) family kinase protein
MDKADINAALVSRLVTSQFPQWADRPITHVEVDGWDNTTFRLGEDMSVRLPSGDVYALQVEKEHKWLPILAAHLPLRIPEPLAKGVPALGYPRPWSVYRWLEGSSATVAAIGDLVGFAIDLAAFLAALYRIDPAGGPPPGKHNFFRGGPLTTYDSEAREAISILSGEVDGHRATQVWEAALGAAWNGSPVWVHGDVSAANLLVVDGRLCAVIDFGSSGVGDPACDVTIAWTLLFGQSRRAFRDRLPVDEATWVRGRGWALWKALITLVHFQKAKPDGAVAARRVVDDVLVEHTLTA